jgi:aerobic carbon-monoxide dehydrogenase medium subunit
VFKANGTAHSSAQRSKSNEPSHIAFAENGGQDDGGGFCVVSGARKTIWPLISTTNERGKKGGLVRHVATAGFVPTSFRTLPRFCLVRARTVVDAVAALSASRAPAILAGGTDLPARFNEGFAPSDLIEISQIRELHQIQIREGVLEIGAAVTHAAGCTHADVRAAIPGFAEAWSRIANVRIRLSATLGGNVMARRPRYEGAILLAALDARLRFAASEGETEVPVTAFVADAPLPRHAMLTTIVIPLRKALRFDYDRSLRPAVTQAIASDAMGRTVVVTATEYALPQVEVMRGADATGTTLSDLRFADPVTSDAYLNRVRRHLFTQQLSRLGAT